uniref:Peptidyl-tRNA hydrolase n=1 Tax=candidate division WOR-3 bacterium TaxID=2052148 RepID=A0A7V3PUW2_UNCW3
MTIFGLGNPGETYANTRHNIGFLVVDTIAQRLGIRFHHQAGMLTARAVLQARPLTLIKPLLFMNNSGIVVREHLSKNPDDFMVVVDDLTLPFGSLRLRPKGSDGGHKGLASIIYHLQTQDFPRLRIGIGSPKCSDATEYVLSTWTPTELKVLPEILNSAADACLCAFQEGLEKAMNRFNSPRTPVQPANQNESESMTSSLHSSLRGQNPWQTKQQ